MCENSYNELNVDDILRENTSDVHNLCIRNESLNYVLDDMQPPDTSNIADGTANLAMGNIIPDLPHYFFSSVRNKKSPSFSSCDVNNDDNQNFMCKRLSEIREQNINKIIVAQLNINSIRNKLEQLVENINKNVDILLVMETKLHDSFRGRP